jgi:hypothetical protein
MVKIRDVVREMDMQSDTLTVYLNKRTGEFVGVTDEDEMVLEVDDLDDELPHWQSESLPKVKEALESDDFVPLPDRFEIHEWDIMRRFCSTVENEDHVTRLLNAIQGRGAFRCFRDQLRDLGLRDDWDRYRDEVFAEIASGWLEENNIPYDREPVERDA